jgi:hypothetical protein
LSDERLLINILEALERILDFHEYYGREGFRTMCILLEEKSIMEKLDGLQRHPNSRIYEIAERLYSKLTQREEEQDMIMNPYSDAGRFEDNSFY